MLFAAYQGGDRPSHYVRDDRPFGGRAPPAALYYAWRDRRQEHPTRHLQSFTGILQADAYSGYNELYDASRAQGPITPAHCWAHARRQFFELADIAANARRDKNAAAISPIALEAVKRIDALFDIERGINGQSADLRRLSFAQSFFVHPALCGRHVCCGFLQSIASSEGIERYP